jgi:hypothetical protein
VLPAKARPARDSATPLGGSRLDPAGRHRAHGPRRDSEPSPPTRIRPFVVYRAQPRWPVADADLSCSGLSSRPDGDGKEDIRSIAAASCCCARRIRTSCAARLRLVPPRVVERTADAPPRLGRSSSRHGVQSARAWSSIEAQDETMPWRIPKRPRTFYPSEAASARPRRT